MPGGETEANISAWTVDSLKEFVFAILVEKDMRYEQRFTAQQIALRDALVAQEKAVQAALLAAQDAVNKAETAAEKRFDAVNEFRAQLADQAATLMPRQETQVLLDGLAERIDQQSKRIGDGEKRINEFAGHARGANDVWGYVIGAFGIFVAVAAIVVAVTK